MTKEENCEAETERKETSEETQTDRKRGIWEKEKSGKTQKRKKNISMEERPNRKL